MSTSLQEGMVFAGRYRILRAIAVGGMGAVYEVLHVETERRRALKVMLPHILQSADMRERFKLEARVAANVDSEFIVDVFDAGVDETTQMPFLVMELLRGEELGKRLRRLGPLSPSELLTYLRQTALALDKTHRASIVHRDLKPENLFLTEREDGTSRIKVLDFGIAKMVAESGTHAKGTQSMGTPLYMSPEQFRSGSQISAASDIYALGMMTYTLLVGEPYWADELKRETNVFAFARHVMNGPTESACERALARTIALPPAFDTWFAKATAFQTVARFESATGAIDALADVFAAKQFVEGRTIPLGEIPRERSSHSSLESALGELGTTPYPPGFLANSVPSPGLLDAPIRTEKLSDGSTIGIVRTVPAQPVDVPPMRPAGTPVTTLSDASITNAPKISNKNVAVTFAILLGITIVTSGAFALSRIGKTSIASGTSGESRGSDAAPQAASAQATLPTPLPPTSASASGARVLTPADLPNALPEPVTSSSHKTSGDGALGFSPKGAPKSSSIGSSGPPPGRPIVAPTSGVASTPVPASAPSSTTVANKPVYSRD